MWRVAGDPGRRLRRGVTRVGPAIWLAGGVCVVMLALLAHGIIRKLGSKPAPVNVRPRPRQGRMPSSAPQAATSLAEWVANPLGTGMVRLERDPPEVVIPPGAVRRDGFRRLSPDGTTDIITYFVESDLPAAEAFYRGKLSAAGYRLAKRASRAKTVKGGRGIILVFRGAHGQQYDVMLIPADNSKRLKIVLMIARSGQPGG